MIIKYIGFLFTLLWSYTFIRTQGLFKKGSGFLITLFVSNISWLTFIAACYYGFKNFSFYNLHYWKYAFTEDQNNVSNYFNEENMLALCGDSFSVGQADGAVVSAQKTFEQIRNVI